MTPARKAPRRQVVYLEEDYFVTSPYREDHTFDGQTAYPTFWHRPLHAMTDAFTPADFTISVINEPLFLPETPGEPVAGPSALNLDPPMIRVG